MIQFIPTEGYSLGICGKLTYVRQPTRVQRIKRAVSDYYRVSMIDLESARRSRYIAHPRQVAMFLAHERSPLSLANIGRQFGNRDHTTVIHAIKAVRRRIAEDEDERADVEYLRGKLRG